MAERTLVSHQLCGALMNEIEKLIQTTSRQHDGEKSAATFWIVVAVVLNAIPFVLIVGLVIGGLVFALFHK